MKFHTFHIRWRSSLWKLLWRELLVYTASFLIISCIYRTCLYPEQQIIVEKLIRCPDGGSVKEGGGNNLSFCQMVSESEHWSSHHFSAGILCVAGGQKMVGAVLQTALA